MKGVLMDIDFLVDNHLRTWKSMRLTTEQKYRSLALDAVAELKGLLDHPERKGETWRDTARATIILCGILEDDLRAGGLT